jgi:hypothetical protein
LVLLRVFPDEVTAQIAISRLRTRQIFTFILTDDCGGMLPAMQPSRGVRVLVPEPRVAEALQILEAMETGIDTGVE